jgi:hypothetical protein
MNNNENIWNEACFTNATEGTAITKGTLEEFAHRWYSIGYEACKKEYEQKLIDLRLKLTAHVCNSPVEGIK